MFGIKSMRRELGVHLHSLEGDAGDGSQFDSEHDHDREVYDDAPEVSRRIAMAEAGLGSAMLSGYGAYPVDYGTRAIGATVLA